MRKLFPLLLTLYCLFNALATLGQNYTPLLNPSNEWQLTSCYEGDCITDIYYTDGDTIVNNLQYKILDGYHYINRNFLVREVIDEKKVFLSIILPNRIDEFLLYDFSLNVGDSIQMRNPLSPFPNNAGFFKLDSIENVFQNNQTYRFFHLSPNENNQISSNAIVWIEGMGGLSIINAPSGIANINGVGKITCFFKNGVLFYQDPSSWGNNCSATLSIASNEKKSPIISYPERKKIKISHAEFINQIACFDMAGNKIYDEKVNSQSSHLIDLKHLNPGIYIIKCFSNQEKFQSFKIVLY